MSTTPRSAPPTGPREPAQPALAADGAPEVGAPADGALEGPAWTALWIRARGWALNLAIVFLAHSADNPQLLNVGRRTLHRVLG